MNIEQQWQNATEEFGDCAFERFFVNYGEDSFTPISNNQAFEHLNALELIPNHNLLDHDVLVYGDDAYLIWEWREQASFTGTPNERLKNAIILNHDYRRKISAALPFDLPRAKTFDAIEVFDGNPDTGWSDAIYDSVCEYCSSVTIVIRKKDYCKFRVYSNDLRMKYPTKLNR